MDISIKAPRLPLPGESVIGNGFMMSPGGKGANQAVAAARLGCPVRLIGCTGNDSYGLELIEHLKRNYVDTRYVKLDDNAYTDIAIITLKDGDNYIVTDPGAKFLFNRPDDHIFRGYYKRQFTACSAIGNSDRGYLS